MDTFILWLNAAMAVLNAWVMLLNQRTSRANEQIFRELVQARREMGRGA